MEKEDKNLLLQDLSARLPYGVKICCTDNPKINGHLVGIVGENVVMFSSGRADFPISDIRSYLRPMSSMTEEEKEELLNRLPKYWGLEIDKLGDLYFDICDASYPDIELLIDIIDWLNAHHFDYNGLIEKGLAIEAPKGMYK